MPDGATPDREIPAAEITQKVEQQNDQPAVAEVKQKPDMAGYADIGTIARGLKEGSLLIDIPGVTIINQESESISVTVDREKNQPDDPRTLIVRDQTVEREIPVEAIDRNGKLGNATFMMREHLPTLQPEQEDLPSMQEIVTEAGADHVYKNYFALEAPGWVSHDRPGKTYFSKINQHFPPDMRVFTIAPIGSSGRKDEVGAVTKDNETPYMDISNYSLVMEEALLQLAAELERKKAELGEEQDGKVLVYGHSWGGRAALETARNRELMQELHDKGLDVVFVPLEPAVRMNTGYGVIPKAVEPVRKMITESAEPRNSKYFAMRRVLDLIRKPATAAIIGAKPMRLEGEDEFMAAIADETSLAQTALPISELSDRPWTKERGRQLMLNPLVAAVQVAEADTLVNATEALKLSKGILLKGEGHVPERVDQVAKMDAKIGMAALVNDQYQKFQEWYKIGQIQQELASTQG